MTDILAALSPMTYSAGNYTVSFPGRSVSFGFSRDIATHRYVFKDEAFMQNLGRKNRTWRIEIPFREKLIYLNYGHLYLTAFPTFFAACSSSEAGMLTTPDAGTVRVLCASFEYTIDPDRRDGVDVRVEFVSAPATDDAPVTITVPTADALAAQGAALDAQVAATNFDNNFKPSSFSSPFTAVQSVFDQLSQSRDKFKATVDAQIAQVDRMQDSLDRLSDPKNWSLAQQGRDFKSTLIRAKQQTDSQGKRLLGIVVGKDAPINTVASALKCSLQEVLTLNPFLARLPFVPAGTTIRYPKKENQNPRPNL